MKRSFTGVVLFVGIFRMHVKKSIERYVLQCNNKGTSAEKQF